MNYMSTSGHYHGSQSLAYAVNCSYCEAEVWNYELTEDGCIRCTECPQCHGPKDYDSLMCGTCQDIANDN